MEQYVSRHMKCNTKCTLRTGTIDKAPEIVPEASYRPSTNKEATGHGIVPSDSCTQPGESDAGPTSKQTGGLEVSVTCSMI
jgi:hypothetical protein